MDGPIRTDACVVFKGVCVGGWTCGPTDPRPVAWELIAYNGLEGLAAPGIWKANNSIRECKLKTQIRGRGFIADGNVAHPY